MQVLFLAGKTSKNICVFEVIIWDHCGNATYVLVFPALMVSLQMPSSVTEGSTSMACVIASLPPGGSDCNVTITLNVTDGTATGESMVHRQK